jgi:hypothetical protein
MRVDDVRTEAPCHANRVGCHADVLRARAAAPRRDDVGELVTTALELRGEIGDERPEVRSVVAGVHLRDEEDAHC